MVTSNPGYEMLELLKIVYHWEKIWWLLCVKYFFFCLFCVLQIHRDSSSSLSKLILQSYHQQIDHVPLTGVTPVHMLLEMGLDKMRKDYINYLIGNLSLITLNLCITLSPLHGIQSFTVIFNLTAYESLSTNFVWYSTICHRLFFLRWRIDNSKPLGKFKCCFPDSYFQM